MPDIKVWISGTGIMKWENENFKMRKCKKEKYI